MERQRRLRRRAIGEAKAHFAECVREVEAGGTILLTRHGRPVARLVPAGGEPPLGCADEVREPATLDVPRRERGFVSVEARRSALRRLLEEEIWPRVPAELRGKRLTRREREQILGYDEGGV